MVEKAIKKINEEIEKGKDDLYIKVVGDFLLNHLGAHPEDAQKILNSEKTIVKSLDEMKKIAFKKKKNNYAMFTPQEGFEIVLKYYGIEGNAEMPKATPAIKEKPKEPVKAKVIDFDVKLEDFM